MLCLSPESLFLIHWSTWFIALLSIQILPPSTWVTGDHGAPSNTWVSYFLNILTSRDPHSMQPPAPPIGMVIPMIIICNCLDLRKQSQTPLSTIFKLTCSTSQFKLLCSTINKFHLFKSSRDFQKHWSLHLVPYSSASPLPSLCNLHSTVYQYNRLHTCATNHGWL